MIDDVINRDPEIMGGTPVFCGTRVPIRILWDHLEAGVPLAEFLADYPTVHTRTGNCSTETCSRHSLERVK